MEGEMKTIISFDGETSIDFSDGSHVRLDPEDADLANFIFLISKEWKKYPTVRDSDMLRHASRVIAERILGKKIGNNVVVFHKNGDLLDNRRSIFRLGHGQTCLNVEEKLLARLQAYTKESVLIANAANG